MQRVELYSKVTCVGDDHIEIKKDFKVSAMELVHYVLENVEKRVSNWCRMKRIIALVLIHLRTLLLEVYRRKAWLKMKVSYEVVPSSQTFPDLESV